MPGLEISKLEMRNFLCFGDYDTSVDLKNIGPVLIVGDRSDGIKTDYRNSNGAGKSTITTAIIWCLFGKTFNIDRPGDRIINWHTGKNCYVKLTTSDGWEIIRTRKMSSRNELELYYNGDNQTLSTATNTQKLINRTFNLDFDIFTSSIFFGQISKSFLEMSDSKRKKALERLLNLNKLNIWAETAKEKIDKIESNMVRINAVIDANMQELDRLNNHLEANEDESKNFELETSNKIVEIKKSISDDASKLKEMHIPDIDALRKRWEVIKKIDNRIHQYNIKKDNLCSIIEKMELTKKNNTRMLSVYDNSGNLIDIEELKIAHKNYEESMRRRKSLEKEADNIKEDIQTKRLIIDNKNSSIKEWEDCVGEVCPYCKQDISKEHTENICEPFIKEVESLSVEIQELELKLGSISEELGNIPELDKPLDIDEAVKNNESINERQGKILIIEQENSDIDTTLIESKNEIESIDKILEQVRAKSKDARPNITLDEAIQMKSTKDLLSQSIDSKNDRIKELENQNNPYDQIITRIRNQINSINISIQKADKSKRQIELLYKHLNYIRTAYSDRRKIKKFILNNLVPLFNSRIQYYLESFDCEFGIEFSSTLSASSTKWDYELCSGGEKKRIDMAIMFALYDLYIYMHGLQCNIMVLDEIDGRLDSDGIESFINVINNDFVGESDNRPKPRTILIISHRNEMLDAFSNKILVKKQNDNSFIDIQI